MDESISLIKANPIQKMQNEILNSWHANAQNWIETIDQEEIISRKLVTNQAIVESVLAFNITSAIDVGCGEGWLTRALNQKEVRTIGLDAIPALIENAQQKSDDIFKVATYQDLAERNVSLPFQVDGAVMNFSLIDKDNTEELLIALPHYLTEKGKMFIQTLHPLAVIEQDSYVSGWREDSWKGLAGKFIMPYQWYFRTLGDWIRLIQKANFQLFDLIEPLHPQTQKPASLIIVAQKQE